MQEHHRAFILSYMILNLASLSFVHAQIIRAWVICMRPWHTQTITFKSFWRIPDLTTARHQRVLWAASVSSIGLFPVSLGLTVLACIKPNLQTQVATVCALTTSSLLRHYTLLTCCLAPDCYNKSKKGGSFILRFPRSGMQNGRVTFA